MIESRKTKAIVLLAAVAVVCAGNLVMAADARIEPAPLLRDVALGSGGLLHGQVVNAQGQPMASASVTIWSQDRALASVNTDNNGYFAIQGLRGGVHQVAAGETRGLYRLWAAGTAPQSSQAGVLLVVDHDTARGQCPSTPSCCAWGSGLGGGIAAHQFLVTGLVATAVAVPVATHISHRPSSP